MNKIKLPIKLKTDKDNAQAIALLITCAEAINELIDKVEPKQPTKTVDELIEEYDARFNLSTFGETRGLLKDFVKDLKKIEEE